MIWTRAAITRTAVTGFLVLACGASDQSTDRQADRGIVGDTPVVRSGQAPAVIRVDSIRVVWQSDALARPRSMIALDEHLVVGDPTALHIVSLSDGSARSVGRLGEGPGEFKSIAAVGAFGLDTIAVFDASLHRLSHFSRAGEYLGSRRVSAAPPFVNSIPDGPPLVRLAGGLLWARSENVNLRRPVQVALLWHDLAADTVHVVSAWDDIAWERLDPFIVHRELFPARALVAVGPAGEVAVGDGLDYCLTTFEFGGGGTRRLCRQWQRVPVGAGIRSPDLTLLLDPTQRENLRSLLRQQEIGDYLPSYDVLRFDTDGRLWVRTMGNDLADVHPHILRQRRDLAPAHRAWDVFATDGRLVYTVELPATFDPRVLMVDRAYGLLELPTGEVVIGEALGW